jgi:cellulose synthase/poly-beta-1,6-N-acetylglucosamine synthase-like glycosyltransferase
MDELFFISIFATGFSYFIYPLILVLIGIFRKSKKSVVTNKDLPSISLIITVHNEQIRITEKLENSLNIDYPKEKLEIIVASDCSTDETDQIVANTIDQGIRIVRADVHKGKEYAQWLAIQKAVGDILVFSDVSTQIPAEAFHIIADIFSDNKVGAVSSEDQFITENGEIVGEGLYVKYEMWLRKLESSVAGLVGLSGSFFAARKNVCEAWDINVPSDFSTALNCVNSGYIAVADERLIGVYKDVKDSSKEYERKVRTVIRGMAALWQKAEILNPVKHGIFSMQVWGHKIMRWLVPWFMLLTFVISIYLYTKHLIYMIAVWTQIIFYGIAIIGVISNKSQSISIIRIISYFTLANIAIAHATILFMMGKRITQWTPSAR